MTNAALVSRKLALLAEHIRRIELRRPTDLETFRTDALLQDAISMSVIVVVQEALDIALHIASDEGWELASTYRERSRSSRDTVASPQRERRVAIA